MAPPAARGPYKIDATATGCGDARTLSGVAELGRQLGPTRARAHRGAAGTPWWLFAAIAIGAFALGVLLSRRRRREPDAPDALPTPGHVTVP